MRFKNSYAAAVAAAVAAIAFIPATPVGATPVVIDSFTTGLGTVAGSGSTTFYLSQNFSIGALPFDTRTVGVGGDPDVADPAPEYAASQTISGGSLAMSLSKTVSGSTPGMQLFNQLSWFNADSTPVNFTTGGNDAIRFSKSSGSYSDGTGGLTASIYISSGTASATYIFTPAQWYSGATLEIPFANFTIDSGPMDWTQVDAMAFNTFSNGDAPSPGGALNATVTLTEVALVPEPATVTTVGAAVAAAAAGLLVRRRRSRA